VLSPDKPTGNSTGPRARAWRARELSNRCRNRYPYPPWTKGKFIPCVAPMALKFLLQIRNYAPQDPGLVLVQTTKQARQKSLSTYTEQAAVSEWESPMHALAGRVLGESPPNCTRP
jgi:hypothetical protein